MVMEEGLRAFGMFGFMVGYPAPNLQNRAYISSRPIYSVLGEARPALAVLEQQFPDKCCVFVRFLALGCHPNEV